MNGLASANRPHCPSSVFPPPPLNLRGLTQGAVLILQEWTAQQPRQAARRVRSHESSDDQADLSRFLNFDHDLDLYHQLDPSTTLTSTSTTTTTSLDHLAHPDLLSPDLWSPQFGSTISPAIGNAGPPSTSITSAAFAHGLMTFGQTWTDSGAGFAAGPSLNDYDFSFDPALIDALPDSIPDFWLVPPPANTTTNDADTDTLQDHQQQQQQLATLTLNPPPQSSPSALAPPTTPAEPQTHSRASSPSSDSPGTSRAGAGRRVNSSKRQDAEDPDVVVKRQRNTIAARKYRQKRLDRIQELEDALKTVTGERDELRLRLARQEAETAALREMMQMKSGKGSE